MASEAKKTTAGSQLILPNPAEASTHANMEVPDKNADEMIFAEFSFIFMIYE